MFFKTGRSFSHFFNKEDFTISVSPIDYSLVDFLNFVVESDSMLETCKMKEKKFLREFVGSFNGFQSGKGLGQKSPGYMDTEILDKAHFISMGLAHSPDEEVTISVLQNHVLPHGNIDLISLVQKPEANVVVTLQCFLGGNVVTGKCSQITPTTVKTKHSYGTPGSDREAIVELLAFSEVLLQSNPNFKCCIILKVSKQLCRPYFYLLHMDLLIRTRSDIQLESDHDHSIELIGSFVISLLMHHHINLNLFEKLKEVKKCGWAEAYQASGFKYNAYISPQKYCQHQQILKEVD